jgi:integrase
MEPYEHPKKSGIKISLKDNRTNGKNFGVSFIVTIPAKVTGSNRQRKQFKEESIAKKWADQQWSGHSKQGEVYFKATTEERNEFASLLPDLREAGISMTEAVRFALPRLRPPGGDKTLGEVITDMQLSKAEMLKRGVLRDRSERTFRTLSGKISDHLGESLIRDLTLDDVVEWLKGMEKAAPRTIRNYLNALAEVMNEAKARGHVHDNILDGLTKTDRKQIYGIDEEKSPEILSLQEAQDLIQTASEHPELDLLGAVTLGLFCGIRTEELKRLDWSAVRLDEGYVTIGADIAKKRKIRNVTLSKNAQAWLSLCPDRSGAVTRSAHYNDYQKRFQKLLKKAGFTEKYKDTKGKEKERVVWKANAMRHSFGTYHFGLHGDSIKTSNELGHAQGDNVLFQHYRALTTKALAKKYFNIKPPAKSGKATQLSKGAA